MKTDRFLGNTAHVNKFRISWNEVRVTFRVAVVFCFTPFSSPSSFSLLLAGGALALETKGSGDRISSPRYTAVWESHS